MATKIATIAMTVTRTLRALTQMAKRTGKKLKRMSQARRRSRKVVILSDSF